MRLSIFSLILIVLSAHVGYAQFVAKDSIVQPSINIRGSVKSVTETGYMNSDINTKMGAAYINIYHFNETGNCTLKKHINFSSNQFDTSNVETNLYVYSNGGKIVKHSWSYVIKNHISKCAITYDYDNKDRLIKENENCRVYDSDNMTYDTSNALENDKPSFVFSYKDLGNGITETIKTGEDSKTILKQDIHGNTIEETDYGKEGNFISRETSKYDNRNNRIENVSYSPKGAVLYKNISKYDNRNNNIENISYLVGKYLASKEIIKYDAKGHKIETEKYKANGDLEYKFTHQYNNSGDWISQSSYYSLDKRYTKHDFSYSYDKQGNFIKTIEINNGKPVCIAKREIKYY